LRNYIEYARSGVLEGADPSAREPDSDFEISVADALRERGLEVVPQLGVAGFFIDLAVRKPREGTTAQLLVPPAATQTPPPVATSKSPTLECEIAA
jgi:hypothetical protein